MAHQLEKVFNKRMEQSKEQATFLKRVAEIKNIKEEVQRLSVEIPKARSEFFQKTGPTKNALTEKYIQRIEVLEDALLNQKLSKKLKSELTDILIQECHVLLEYHPQEQRIQDIYNRYRNDDPEMDKELDEILDRMFDSQFGESETNQNTFGGDPASKNFQKKHAKAQAKADAQKRSIRDIYKDLIKIIHPDKEQDQEEKKRKEELAKEINAAYKNNDLLKLLEFEIQFLSSSTERINDLAKDRLKMYNEILLKQKKELEGELYDLKNENHGIYQNMCTLNSNPDKFIKQVLKEMQEQIGMIDDQLHYLQNDKNYLKLFISNYMEQIERELFG